MKANPFKHIFFKYKLTIHMLVLWVERVKYVTSTCHNSLNMTKGQVFLTQTCFLSYFLSFYKKSAQKKSLRKNHFFHQNHFFKKSGQSENSTFDARHSISWNHTKFVCNSNFFWWKMLENGKWERHFCAFYCVRSRKKCS